MFSWVGKKIRKRGEQVPVTLLGKGRRLSGRGFGKKEEIISLPDADRKGHFWCFGTTRVGKTRLLESIVEQDLKKGYDLVVIDPKGDMELFSKIVEIALETGREEDLMVINPIFPDISMGINPLSHYQMIEEVVGHVVSSVETGPNDIFFYNVAYETSLVIVLSLIALSKEEGTEGQFDLNQIKKYVSRDQLEKLLTEVERLPRKYDQLKMDLTKIAQSPPDYYNKVITTLRVALMELTSGNIGEVIGKGSDNRFMDRLEEGKGVILVVQLGSLMTRKAAFTLGKVILSMLQAFVGRVFYTKGSLERPLVVMMDEAQSLLYPGIEELFAKAGGANVMMHGFCQSVSQLEAELGRERARAILDNTNSKVYMRVPDTKTAEEASVRFGKWTKLEGFLAVEGGISGRPVEKQVLEPDRVENLQVREMLVLSYGGRWKGQTDEVRPGRIKVLLPGEEVSFKGEIGFQDLADRLWLRGAKEQEEDFEEKGGEGLDKEKPEEAEEGQKGKDDTGENNKEEVEESVRKKEDVVKREEGGSEVESGKGEMGWFETEHFCLGVKALVNQQDKDGKWEALSMKQEGEEHMVYLRAESFWRILEKLAKEGGQGEWIKKAATIAERKKRVMRRAGEILEKDGVLRKQWLEEGEVEARFVLEMANGKEVEFRFVPLWALSIGSINKFEKKKRGRMMFIKRVRLEGKSKS